MRWPSYVDGQLESRMQIFQHRENRKSLECGKKEVAVLRSCVSSATAFGEPFFTPFSRCRLSLAWLDQTFRNRVSNTTSPGKPIFTRTRSWNFYRPTSASAAHPTRASRPYIVCHLPFFRSADYPSIRAKFYSLIGAGVAGCYGQRSAFSLCSLPLFNGKSTRTLKH